MAFIDQLLGRGEHILYVAEQHILLLVGHIFAKFTLIGIVVAACYKSYEAFLDDGKKRVVGLTASQLFLVFGILITLYLLSSILSDYLRWNNEKYIITDRRVIQIRGAWNKTVVDSMIDRVRDVSLTQGVLGRMFDYGSIAILPASDTSFNAIGYITKPLAFKRALYDAQHNYERGFGYLDVQGSDSDASPSSKQNDIHRAIEDLVTLRDRGILSPDEFEMKKRELIKRM
jgi:uncharacterized membrane protein YdbT with pleckstrin-like domain